VTFAVAGYLAKQLSSLRLLLGLTGRGQKPPPQLGQTFAKSSVAHFAQKVHSKLQIIASIELAGRSLSQCSHEGLKANILQLSSTIDCI
jgi:hypothetical protein